MSSGDSLNRFPGMPGFGGTRVTQLSDNSSQGRAGSQGGTSFVLGGGGLRARPTPNGDQGNGRQYQEDRYRFDPHDISCNGTSLSADDAGSRRGGRSKQSSSRERLTELEVERSTKVQRIGFGLILYGVALVLFIAAVMGLVSGGSSDDIYNKPRGDGARGRPMWAR